MLTTIRVHEPFVRRIREEGLALGRTRLETLQVNLGKVCNQACHHCHVDAGPQRTERMEWPTVERIIELVDTAPTLRTVDITGGAPELNENFRTLVVEMRRRGKEIIDRCNLTVLLEPGQEDTAAFLARQAVRVVASLPCYSRENVDAQRGGGVFGKSVKALRRLNSLGYGMKGSRLVLDLVYNPGGPFLPPPQSALEEEYRRHLLQEFGVRFNHLLTLANMPISRFLHSLERSGQLEDYMTLLVDSFNPRAAIGVMCRTLVSIGWDGQVYDCDFNQMLEIPAAGRRKTVWDIDSLQELGGKPIAFGDHCYGCTAGAGSSCGGALV